MATTFIMFTCPLIHALQQILADGKLYVDQVRESDRTPVVSVLVHGPAGSGKTALAATIALESEFPFIKLISPESMVGMTESAKIAEINKVWFYDPLVYDIFIYMAIYHRSSTIHTSRLPVLSSLIVLSV